MVKGCGGGAGCRRVTIRTGESNLSPEEIEKKKEKSRSAIKGETAPSL